MLQGNSKRILAVFSAVVFISSMCSAQIRTVPNIKRVPPPVGTVAPGGSSTPSTNQPGNTSGAAIKPIRTTPNVVAPVPKGTMVDYSAKLAQLKTVSVSMICATSDSGPKSVILKWVIDNEWLPDQGYNLYRKGPGESEFKKIAGPIKENPNAASISLPTVNGIAKTVNISALQKQAHSNVQIPADMMRAFAPAPINIETSQPVFDELKLLRVKEFTPIIVKTRPDFTIVKPDSFPKLNNYYLKFKMQRTMPFNLKAVEPGASSAPTVKSLRTTPGARTATQKLAPVVKSPVQVTVEARRALLMGALVNKPVCDALGLGYVDSAVTEGQTYDYQLRRVTGSSDAATSGVCTITVGADPLPGKPADLSACQLNVKSVVLRWKLDDSKTSARVISYSIYRTQSGKKQLLNAQPLMVGPVEDGKGNFTDPLYYFTDKDVPVGNILYELVGVDAFGRQTAPAKLDFSMADWETPLSVNQVTCAVNNGQVYLYWQPVPKASTANGPMVMVPIPVTDKAAMYNVYRCDQEGSKVWTKLNDEPVQPSYIPPPTLGKQYSTKLAMMKKGSNLSFIDKTCQKDAYYLYTVVAVYKKNMIESAPSPAQTVGVPDLDLPAKVANFAGKHVALVSQTPAFNFDARWANVSSRSAVPIAKVKNLSFDPSILTAKPASAQKAPAGQPLTIDKTVAPVGSGVKKAVGAQPIGRSAAVKMPSDLIKATIDNSDLGGKIVLTWEPSPMKAPVRYKVYRASGTGYRVISGLDKLVSNSDFTKSFASINGPKPAPAIATSPDLIGAAAEARSLASVAYMAAKPADVKITPSGKQTNIPAVKNNGVSLEFIKKVDLSAVMDDSYQFLGETKSPTYYDCLPKSRPMYYNYRVVPINRWGIEGKSAAIQVRVAATVPPPTPEIVSTYANLDGGVTVSLKPLENKEECAKYLLYRKPIDISLFMPLVTINARVPAIVSSAPAPSAAAKASEPLTFRSDMKITPMSAMVSPSVASKAMDRGMKVRSVLPMANAEFAKNLRLALAKPDYEVVGEISPDAIDKSGYVRYNDMKNLVPYQLYSYTIIAVDADAWKSTASKPETASPWKVTVPPVSGLKAATSGSGIVLSWTAPAGEIVGYAVLKGVAKNTEFVQISDTIKPKTFTDFSVIKGRTYTYRVAAVDSLGNLSEPVSVEFKLPK
ncbi:MAG: fibronectin type III domain-containing protein [Armatimonadetes bacterium]|nr:fibronectin type III domain-containing protein [Armatimonadota bacterium]